MGISFSSLQCKRSHPPEVKEEIVWETPPRISASSWKGFSYEFIEPLDTSFVDPTTKKRFKASQPDEQDITDMLSFYGIDQTKTYKCPVCDLKGSLRTLLPHLNNTSTGYIEISESTGSSIAGVCELRESHGWNFKQLGKWMESLGY